MKSQASVNGTICTTCDFIEHCSDSFFYGFADEEICVYPDCPSNYFTCDNKQCVEMSRFCDGIFDCYDGSDEMCAETKFNKNTLAFSWFSTKTSILESISSISAENLTCCIQNEFSNASKCCQSVNIYMNNDIELQLLTNSANITLIDMDGKGMQKPSYILRTIINIS